MGVEILHYTGINLENPNSGSEEVTAILRTRHPPIITQRNGVQAALREADPVGTASRWSRVIQRRRYSVPSPNAVWHLDTNHALRRWRFVVHGGIDGFSRLVTFLRASSNNRAKTSFVFFLRSVADHGLPSRIRTDNGGEYVHVRRFMNTELGPNRGSAISGQSTHSQRIERLWRDVFTKVLDKFYKLFYHMEDYKLLDKNNEIHVFALHHTFLPRIDAELTSKFDELVSPAKRVYGEEWQKNISGKKLRMLIRSK
ncbi:uncharacterized protein LOC123532085 [Mercenaria mercenaria]|uniref:uncharacterized protein LOC123532085 n=1 Tax=Mercenaria mercenaria TaxID=6596 RepID=UPI00234F1500|nr:uncharacterized protein LOC123532085 [Mercenaria mercenaria]